MSTLLNLALSMLLSVSADVTVHLPLQTAVVAYAPHVLIDVDAGDVLIESWSNDKVSLSSNVSTPDLTVSFQQTGNTVLVHAKIGHAAITPKALRSSYVLRVPASAVIELYSASGNVSVNGVYGPLDLNANSGAILLDS